MTGYRRPAPWQAPWRTWYYLERWRRLRRLQLRGDPLCAICLKRGVVSVATIADHIEPHHGDWNQFLTGKLQSLCFNCHNSSKQFQDRHGYLKDIGPDGWPIDPRHPANQLTRVPLKV